MVKEIIKKLFHYLGIILLAIWGCLFIYGVCYILSWSLCDIEAETTYTWYSGFWHGVMWPFNFIRHLHDDNYCIAPLHTAAYSFWFYFTVIGYSIDLVLGAIRK